MKIIISPEENARTLGEVLRERGFSKRLIVILKHTENGMTRNGHLIRTVDKVFSGEEITLREGKNDIPLEPNGELKVQILFEDEDLIVFNKPPFMPVHPSLKHQGDTLGNFFAYHCPKLTFRAVNRLDRDTGGCVVVAKNQRCARLLQESCQKVYCGIVKNFPLNGGRISAPIARMEKSIILRCVREDGQPSITNFLVAGRKGEYSLLEFYLETGRTHQIRVHIAHKGFPLVGDEMYGGEHSEMNRQALHCARVKFIQPSTGKEIQVEAPLPEDMKKLVY